ncbi:D-alanyl-D-alanine carboxypeptidase/D-alanyl-D-alanine-endopeptidase [Planctomycetota bacterium]
MKVRFRKLLFAGLLFIVCFAGAASADLAKQINSIINGSSQKKVIFSIQIAKAESGKVIYSYKGNRVMIPASNMKIVTTAAALEYLGPNFEYTTIIGLSGDMLVVIGSGDPLLGDDVTDERYGREAGWIFKDIAAALKAAGQKKIKDIIVDSTVFDDERVNPSWSRNDLNRWYACEVAGLNYNGNCVEITATNTSNKVELTVEPASSFIKITNNVKPIQTGRGAVGSYRQPAVNDIVVFGKCREKQGPINVAIERPAAFFGFLLAEELTGAGINVTGQFIEKKCEPDTKIKELLSCRTKLSDVLTRCNKDSFGLAAEALLKTIAANANRYGENGGWEAGRGLISRYLVQLGVDRNELYIDDGSGLSRENRLSANAITKVLVDVYNSKNRSLYEDSLAAGGIDGTISRYFKEEKYKGKVLGKTGYIDGVKTFSGLCQTSDGDYIFSILANNTNGGTRTAINKIAKAIIDEY